MCLCMKSARYLLTYLDCCLFLFVLIILFLSIYILLHIFNAFSAPCCNAFILCKMCYTNKFDFDFDLLRNISTETFLYAGLSGKLLE